MSGEGNVFDRAREVLRERGWAQGEGSSIDGRVCLLGAVCVAKGESPHNWDIMASRNAPEALALADVIEEQYGSQGTDIRWRGHIPYTWQDGEGRTLGEVDAILDKCARITDEQVPS